MATLVKFDLVKGEIDESCNKPIQIDIPDNHETEQDEKVFACFANFSTVLKENDYQELSEEDFLESVFFEIQFETYDKTQYYGEIRKLSKPNDIIYFHEMDHYANDDDNHECKDYLSTKDILYMNVLENYNDLEWK